jgi:GNAT superfamily N-acetyltransferase
MTVTTESTSSKPLICQLRPIELNDQEQYRHLQAQRKECGWYYEDVYLRRWREAAVVGTKCLFWIITSPPDAGQPTMIAGHISLDAFSESEDPQHELARPDKSLLTISTFFVLPEFRGGGIGRQAMSQVEQLAKVEPYGHPSCSAIAIMSLSCRYVEDPVLRGRYIEWTGETPSSYERWYSRMGYVKWKEEACTEIVGREGQAIFLVEAFMKKTLSNTATL